MRPKWPGSTFIEEAGDVEGGTLKISVISSNSMLLLENYTAAVLVDCIYKSIGLI